MAEAIEIPWADGAFPGLSAVPAGRPRAAVVVVQEAFGLTRHIGAICDRLAAEGYRAVAPALYHRVGAPVLSYLALSDAEKATELIEVVSSVTRSGIEADLDATLALLAAEGFAPERTAMVGFCMGGAITLLSCTRPGIAGGVTFYGGGVATGRFDLPPLVELAPAIVHPWLGLYGDLDASIPVDDVEELRSAAARAGAQTEIVRYEHAQHGFNCDERPEHFEPASAADAWGRTLDFLGQLFP